MVEEAKQSWWCTRKLRSIWMPRSLFPSAKLSISSEGPVKPERSIIEYLLTNCTSTYNLGPYRPRALSSPLQPHLSKPQSTTETTNAFAFFKPPFSPPNTPPPTLIHRTAATLSNRPPFIPLLTPSRIAAFHFFVEMVRYDENSCAISRCYGTVGHGPLMRMRWR